MVHHMHIPDGYLDLRICVLFYILSGAFIVLAINRVGLRDEIIPLYTSLAAIIFAAQMLDWPVPGGTTAHFTGGALAGIILGPWGGILVMTIVLVIQALVFGDGGILSLGANIWNMGIVAPLVGYTVYSSLRRYGYIASVMGAFIGGWLSSLTASFFAGLQLGLSTIFLYPITVTIPAMMLYHLGFGLIDGVVCGGVVAYMIKFKHSTLTSKP
jgi:cobalt/nickel transport system permease protein